MRNLSDKRLHELAESMEGGINSVNYFLEEGEELSLDDEEELSFLVSSCDTCGWNYCRDDMEQTEYGELLCWRCYEDEEE